MFSASFLLAPYFKWSVQILNVHALRFKTIYKTIHLQFYVIYLERNLTNASIITLLVASWQSRNSFSKRCLVCSCAVENYTAACVTHEMCVKLIVELYISIDSTFYVKKYFVIVLSIYSSQFCFVLHKNAYNCLFL